MKHFKFLSFFFFKSFAAFLTFAYIFLSTKILSPTEYGVFALLITLIVLGSSLFSLGIPAFFFEIISSNKRIKKIHEIMKYLSVIILLVSLIVCLIFFLFSVSLSQLLFKSIEYNLLLKIFGVFIIFGIINRIFSSYYVAKGNYIISTIGDNYLFPILIIFLLTFYSFSENLIFINYLEYIIYILPIITIFFLFFINLNFSFILIRTKINKYFEYLKPCIELSSITISGIILLSSDIIILGILSEPAIVSNYHIATKFASLVALILATSSSLYFGKIIKMYKEKNFQILKNTFLKANFYSALLSFFLIFFILLSYDIIVSLFFFDINSKMLFFLILILCIGQFINVIFGFQGSMVVMLPELRRKISLAFLLTVKLNILLSIVGFIFFGSIGIALATMLSILLREIFISYFFKKHYGFHPLFFFKNINYLK